MGGDDTMCLTQNAGTINQSVKLLMLDRQTLEGRDSGRRSEKGGKVGANIGETPAQSVVL